MPLIYTMFSLNNVPFVLSGIVTTLTGFNRPMLDGKSPSITVWLYHEGIIVKYMMSRFIKVLSVLSSLIIALLDWYKTSVKLQIFCKACKALPEYQLHDNGLICTENIAKTIILISHLRSGWEGMIMLGNLLSVMFNCSKCDVCLQSPTRNTRTSGVSWCMWVLFDHRMG